MAHKKTRTTQPCSHQTTNKQTKLKPVHLSSDTPHSGSGPLRVPAEAGGVYGVVRLGPPPQPARLLNQPACIAAELRSGLRWLKRSGDDPVGCWC